MYQLYSWNKREIHCLDSYNFISFQLITSPYNSALISFQCSAFYHLAVALSRAHILPDECLPKKIKYQLEWQNNTINRVSV